MVGRVGDRRFDDLGGVGVTWWVAGARAVHGALAGVLGWAGRADFELGLGADDGQLDRGEAAQAAAVEVAVLHRHVVGLGLVGSQQRDSAPATSAGSVE